MYDATKKKTKCAMWHGVEMTIVFKGQSLKKKYINGHNQTENDFNIISRLSKACWR